MVMMMMMVLLMALTMSYTLIFSNRWSWKLEVGIGCEKELSLYLDFY